MLVVNSKTGERASYNDESIIIEAFKEKNLILWVGKNLIMWLQIGIL